MFCKLPIVQGKKSSAMMFSIIITMTLALVTLTTTTTTTAAAAVSPTSKSSQSNQNVSSSIQQINQPPYNATQNMISAFKIADSLLMQALNNLNTGKTQGALKQLNMAKTQIEQYQLAALDAMSNPVLQLSREHLLAAENALKMRNTDKAISELRCFNSAV